MKAGMDEVDQEEVKRVIAEASGHSEFFKNSERKLVQVEKKVQNYLAKLRRVKSDKLLWMKTVSIVQKAIEEYANKRETNRTWIHVDLDMFYAACEIRDNPKLARKPLAVGDNSMIQTTNYIARKYGVKSGMPGFIGRKLCPHLVFVKPNYKKYRAVSDVFKGVIKEYDLHPECAGLDEANLDVTDFLQNNDLDHELGRIFVAKELRTKIYEAIKITSSCGIACNKMMAKICSELNKPNGQTYMPNDEIEILKFMKDMPVRKIPGVGKATEHIMAGLNISACKDIIEKATEVYATFTEFSFEFLIKSAMGISRTAHEMLKSDITCQKSMGVSATFKPIHRYG